MNQTVVRVPPGPAAKISGVIYLIFGILLSPVFLLPALLGEKQQPAAVVVALLTPILYGAGGFVATASFCWIYNLIAPRLGGVQIELRSESGS
jgi:hypothetical protein